MTTNDNEIDLADDKRYSRQILALPLGKNSPLSCNRGHILVVGAGGVGSPAITYLAGAGIPHLTLADFDSVDTSNLHRQFLHTERGAKECANKADSAKFFCENYNSKVKITTIKDKLTDGNVDSLLRDASLDDPFDVILDTSDNPECRFLIADYCYRNRLPLVHAAGIKWQISVTTIIPPEMISNLDANKVEIPCFRCLYNNPPKKSLRMTAATVGIVGPTCGISGSIGAGECLKILTLPRSEAGDQFADSYEKLSAALLIGRLCMYNLWENTVRQVRYVRKNSCRCCNESINSDKDDKEKSKSNTEDKN